MACVVGSNFFAFAPDAAAGCAFGVSFAAGRGPYGEALVASAPTFTTFFSFSAGRAGNAQAGSAILAVALDEELDEDEEDGRLRLLMALLYSQRRAAAAVSGGSDLFGCVVPTGLSLVSPRYPGSIDFSRSSSACYTCGFAYSFT